MVEMYHGLLEERELRKNSSLPVQCRMLVHGSLYPALLRQLLQSLLDQCIRLVRSHFEAESFMPGTSQILVKHQKESRPRCKLTSRCISFSF